MNYKKWISKVVLILGGMVEQVNIAISIDLIGLLLTNNGRSSLKTWRWNIYQEHDQIMHLSYQYEREEIECSQTFQVF